MARLIEFFTKGGELVLDPFAGVGGTLLGAAICRTPRRAIGFEIEPRWAAVYRAVAEAAAGESDGDAPVLVDLGDKDPGGPRRFDASGCRLATGDAMELIRDLDEASVDLVATDPPYNPQLKATMSGGALSETFANRRTDYAMITDDPADIANSATYGEYLERMGMLFGELRRVLKPKRYAVVIVRDAYQDSSYRFVASDLAARAGPHGFTTKGDLIWYQAGTRLRPYGYPHVFVPNIVHQHVLVLRAE
jgi:DNA modification methylase